jgi:glycolate oxidase FAD binding subunit
VNTQQLLSQFAALVGVENLAPGVEQVPPVWGTKPICLVRPASEAQICALVRLAEEAGVGLLPCGGGTQFQTGFAPAPDRAYLLISTERMNQITDYQPDDLTVTCEAGVTLAQVQTLLAPHRQMLALDVPYPDRATMGGVVSTNAAGFWRAAYGTPRDLLIGVRAVMQEGVAVKGGGKVVKNVAGYDVCKLFTGAWGTLGILAELTFKVRALPEVERTLAWNAPDLPAAARVGLELHHAQLAPTFLLATNDLDNQPCLIAGLQGTQARVDWQAEELARRVAALGVASSPNELAMERVTSLRDRQARLEPGTPLAASIRCLPADLPACLARLDAIGSLCLSGHCATGLISLGTARADLATALAIQNALPAESYLTWTRLEGELFGQEQLPVWGPPRPEFALHRALKQSLDPRGTFNPGRFLGGL